MSLHAFTLEGHRGHLLVEEPYLPHILKDALIQVFDIGEPELFGAIYPDSARIVVPRAWFPVAERNYERLKQQRALYPPTQDGHPAPTPKIRLRR